MRPTRPGLHRIHPPAVGPRARPRTLNTYFAKDGELRGATFRLRDGGSLWNEGQLDLVSCAVDMRDGQVYADTLRLLSSNEGIGTISGYGYAEVSGGFHNSGRVIADGFGETRTLDFSTVTAVTSDETNTAGFGWFAQNQGSLLMPGVKLAGDGLYTFGDDMDKEHLGLVNSVRLSLTGANFVDDDTFLVSLLATDHPGIHASSLPFISVWDFRAPVGFDFSQGGLTFRYDNLRLSSLGLDASVLRVYHFDGLAWMDVTGGIDLSTYSIFTREIDSFSMYAIAIPEPATVALVFVGLLGLAGRRHRRP